MAQTDPELTGTLPGVQTEHTRAAEWLRQSAIGAKQSLSEDWLDGAVVRPAGHAVQTTIEPAGLKVPVGQTAQVLEAVIKKKPPIQASQSTQFAVEQ